MQEEYQDKRMEMQKTLTQSRKDAKEKNIQYILIFNFLCGLRVFAVRFVLFYYPFVAFSIFAQVSRSVTVRLNTGFPGRASRSAQKYPLRSN
jgi:hypothetical protein